MVVLEFLRGRGRFGGVGSGLGCGGEIDDDEGEDLGVSGAGSRCRGV